MSKLSYKFAVKFGSIMKKVFVFLVLSIFNVVQNAFAQVDNYCLRFTSGDGVVNCGVLSDVYPTKASTLQFWFCPEEWVKGAALVRVGSFSVKLGDNHTLVFDDGTNYMIISSTANISAGKWCHVTMRVDTDETSVSINNGKARTLDKHLTMPTTTYSLWLGGCGYTGRMDEIRVWRVKLNEDYNSFYNNTINKFAPQWASLAAYYKCDQEQCENLVDYSVKNRHNGTMSASGVQKELVTDNQQMKYRITLGYGNIERFFDRQIDAEHYNTLANVIAIIGIWTYNDGSARTYSSNDAGTLSDSAEYVAEFEGRKGVLHVASESAVIKLPTAAMADDTYTFETWLYVEEWTDGAYIMRKERWGTNGLSIRLGSEGRIVARINGKDKVIATGKTAGKWFHVGVCSGDLGGEALSGVDAAPVTLGQGLKGYFDETLFWGSSRGSSYRTSDSKLIPYPGPDVKMSMNNDMYNMRACYDYDKPDDVGFDRYSVDGYIDYMRSFTSGMRGVKFILSAAGPEDLDGTLADETKREKMATDIAAIVNSPYIDGVDFDFEWTYTQTGWNNEGDLAKRVREKVQDGKIVSVSVGSWSCSLPKKYFQYIDFITCQQYGPQPANFTMDSFRSSYNTFVSKGLPKDKLLLSFATTTSAGYKDGSWASAVQGYRYLYGETFTDDMDSYTNDAGIKFCFTGVNQTIDRTNFVRNNDLGGIFYWDLGNDLQASHKASLARNSSYYINANVEKFVTSVASAACAPENDDCGPIDTPDPTAIEVASQQVASSLGQGACAIYNIAGQVVDKGYKGLVISAGKKIIVP